MQVLLQLGDTKLKRTASLMCPDLFQFEQHFEFLEIMGRSQHSEVSGAGLVDALCFRGKMSSAACCLLLQHTLPDLKLTSASACRYLECGTRVAGITLLSRSQHGASSPKRTGKGQRCCSCPAAEVKAWVQCTCSS